MPLLSALPEHVVEFLSTSSELVSAEAGATIFREGDPGDRFYVIERGEVEILGRTFAAGEGFGEIALLRDVPRTATVIAVSDVSLIALERDVFITAVTGHGPASSRLSRCRAETSRPRARPPPPSRSGPGWTPDGASAPTSRACVPSP